MLSLPSSVSCLGLLLLALLPNVVNGVPLDEYPPELAPVQIYEGKIQVRYLEGVIAGNISKMGFGDYYYAGINHGYPADQDLVVEIAVPGDDCGYSGPYDLIATDPGFPNPYYVGSVGNATMGTGIPSSTTLGNVFQTPPGSVPIQSGDRYYESAIWQINGETRELTAFYTNPDGTTIQAQLAYFLRYNTLGFSGDIRSTPYPPLAYASQVQFFLIDA